MARTTKQVVQNVPVVVDDYTGREIPEGEVQVVALTYKGRTLRADLSRASVKSLDKMLSSYFGEVNDFDSKGDPELVKIRKWATEEGYYMSTRGAVSDELRAAYEAAH